VVKVPADPNVPYKGTYFINFDSEGTTDFVSQTAWLVQEFLGDGGWDFIGFDMRGSGYSTPQLSCFKDKATQDSYATASHASENIFGAFNGTFPPTDSNIKANIKIVSAYMEKFGKGCNELYGKYLP
jgi:pimeloyl-ACP methyl ester carboxylesterase